MGGALSGFSGGCVGRGWAQGTEAQWPAMALLSACSLQPAGAQGGGSSFPTTRQVVPSGLDAPQESSVPYIFGIAPEFQAALHFPTPGVRPQQSWGRGETWPQGNWILRLSCWSWSANHALRTAFAPLGLWCNWNPGRCHSGASDMFWGSTPGGAWGTHWEAEGEPCPEGMLRCVLTALEWRPCPEEPPCGQALGPGALPPQMDLPACGQAGPRGQCREWTASSLFHAWQQLGGCGPTQSCHGWRTQAGGHSCCLLLLLLLLLVSPCSP